MRILPVFRQVASGIGFTEEGKILQPVRALKVLQLLQAYNLEIEKD